VRSQGCVGIDCNCDRERSGFRDDTQSAAVLRSSRRATSEPDVLRTKSAARKPDASRVTKTSIVCATGS
jgi:hypothetical protein